nr:MAG TPA: hypothetical protein [Caudoviricetes sp.]
MIVRYKKICVELLEAISTYSEEDAAKINATFTSGTAVVYSEGKVEFSSADGEHTIEKTKQGWEHTVVKVRSGSEVTDVI